MRIGRLLSMPSVAVVVVLVTASSGYGWNISYVDSSEAYQSGYGSLALASDGTPWVSYLRDAGGGSNWLMLAHLTATGWEYEEVLYRVWPNPATVLMLDSNDYPHIVFHNIDGYRLDYV
ncbi:MAG: hypothetical protein MUE60_16420, partial [Candidatus Eisenbacteria bacterium]|nr:hypothetical protein [Candidatus Eisenbacteria bacterium]